jgi:hypothetical protein
MADHEIRGRSPNEKKRGTTPPSAAAALSPRQRRSTTSSNGRRFAREIHSAARRSGFGDRPV